jgi:spermidine synthase
MRIITNGNVKKHMIPWKLLSSTITPDHNSELKLYQRGMEYSIRVNGLELMNSRVFGSEEHLASLSCSEIAERNNARVLIGGLGMGYTLAAALKSLKVDAEVTVSELVPSVVEWNQGVLGPLAGSPLEDSRVTVLVEDVLHVIDRSPSAFDAILLDVDNGPKSITQPGNDQLYSLSGLSMIHRSLRPGGVVAVWSAAPDIRFTKRLKASAFHVREKSIRARARKKGPVHTIWIARKDCGGGLPR